MSHIYLSAQIQLGNLQKKAKVMKPELNNLSHILRNKNLWPEGFEWDYSHCHTCAMGLAHKLWKEQIEYPLTNVMAKVFDMSSEAAGDIFTGMGKTLEDEQNITPEQVADAIDAYIANKK